MARVALVTGGTRGIGHAISIALKNSGYRVVASYAGNDAAAQQFQAETGIPVYKFDVGNYEATEKAVQQIAKDVGPIDVLVNNAGITRDTMFHKMTKQQWDEVIGTTSTVSSTSPARFGRACAPANSAVSSTSRRSMVRRARWAR